MEVDERAVFLDQTVRRLLAGCRIEAHDGTVLYTPDGRAYYTALWTRDFAYMVENAGDLMPPQEVEGCIRILLNAQRADGVIPDRVRPDGLAVYSAGSEEQPLAEWNLDNGPFLVIAVDEHLRRLEAQQAEALFSMWGLQLAGGLKAVPLSEAGLVWNDPAAPHSPYGFTDTVCKTGELLFESLLYWSACRRLAYWLERADEIHLARGYDRRAQQIEENLARLWDDEAGAFMAASHDCRQIDVWGNAFAVWLDFPLGERREAITGFLAANYERIIQRGQVRHLLYPETWQRLFIPIPAGEYQNGAYWATASGWVRCALCDSRPDLAERLLADLTADFEQNGVHECVNGENRKLESYVVSAVNIYGALRRE